jgi:ArsR family transcriptional regulator
MIDLERCFKGLADTNRLRIVNLLLYGELCGCDIQYVLETSQPNVSRHLTYLKHAGLVSDRREGFRVFYRLSDENTGKLKALFHFLQDAFDFDSALRQDVARLKQAIKDGACIIQQIQPLRRQAAARPGARPAGHKSPGLGRAVTMRK